MGDVLRHAFPGIKLLEYPMHGSMAVQAKALGKPARLAREAYDVAVRAQDANDRKLREEQAALLTVPGLKILAAGHPYVLHDPMIGGAVVRALTALGCVPLYSDRFDRAESLRRSGEVSPRLYWTAGREIVGSLAAHQDKVDGALLLTAFPCAPDALAFEMAMRTFQDFPMTLILLDGLHGEAGLQTRLECFADILRERKRRRESDHHFPAHGAIPHSHHAGIDHAVPRS